MILKVKHNFKTIKSTTITISLYTNYNIIIIVFRITHASDQILIFTLHLTKQMATMQIFMCIYFHVFPKHEIPMTLNVPWESLDIGSIVGRLLHFIINICNSVNLEF